MTIKRLSERAYADIVNFIGERSLRVGDRLPAESKLAEMIGVSRTVVREALVRLEADGLTETRLGAGSYVTRLPSALLARHMQLADLPAILGTYEVRFVLEAEAARLAALRRSNKEMTEISARMNSLRRALRSNAFAHAEDLALHKAIIAGAGNEAFLCTFDALHDGVERIMKAGIDISRSRSQEIVETMISEHEEIVEAIRLHDPERAALSMRWHLSQGRRRLMP